MPRRGLLERHSEERGARQAESRIYRGLAVKAPGPVRRDVQADRTAVVALRVQQAESMARRYAFLRAESGTTKTGRRQPPYRA